MADTPKEAKRLTRKDWDNAAEYIFDELATRKRMRQDKERIWNEVDRQVAQIARPTNLDDKGNRMPGTAWQTFKELPWQAQSLELLSADSHRLIFPDDRNWFSAHASVDDLSLADIDKNALLGGTPDILDEGSVTSQDIEAIIEGTHTHFQDIYKFRNAWDRMTISAIKYGTMVGRARIARIDDFSHETRGVIAKSQKIPVIVPMDVRKVYLDDGPSTLQHSDQILPPSPIFTWKQRVSDLMLAASRGGESEGWIASNLKGVEGDDGGYVEIAEYEGDIVIPRKSTESIYLANVVITAVSGQDSQGKSISRVIRYRDNGFNFSSYIIDVYHPDDFSTNYGTSPLIKGMPVQQAATDAFNRLCHSAILNTEPPIGFDSSDAIYAANGGPKIEPRALWATMSRLEIHQIGDPDKLLQVYLALVQQFQEVTGVSSTRLGGQTKSHQTRFAVDTEVQRGVVRTVDFTRHMMDGALRTWLSLEHEMIRKIMSGNKRVPMYIPKLGSFLNVSGKEIPEAVSFDVHGVAGPLEEREKQQARTGALAAVAQMEEVAVQQGGDPLNWNALRTDLLREGGIFDAGKYFIQRQPQAGGGGSPLAAQAGPGAAAPAQGPIDPNALVNVAAGIS